MQIAPMMDVTYRDFRYFMRLLTRRAQLWTEMVVDDTVLHNLELVKCDRFLGFHAQEHPVVCQLGGSDPTKLAEVAQVVQRYGYDEVNLNVGCPSCRVSQGEFGCSLMKKKDVVRDIVHAMSRSVQIPVTVKCRLGVDELDSPEFTRDFISTVAAGGCKHFIIHARKAWLKGLSPAQNRSLPPLQYNRVLDLCHHFPDLSFSLNGGIADAGQARALLGFPGDQRLDGETQDLVARAWGVESGEAQLSLPPNLLGVMIGRGAMNTPMMLWDVDSVIYGDPRPAPMTRRRILDEYRAYLEEMHPPGDASRSVGCLHLATKPTLGLFAGMPGNKVFRGTVDKLTRSKESREQGPAHVLEDAMKHLDELCPGLLDKAMQPTVAYVHKETRAAVESDGACPPAVAQLQMAARGKKRKGAREDCPAPKPPNANAGADSGQATGGDQTQAPSEVRPDGCCQTHAAVAPLKARKFGEEAEEQAATAAA